MHFVRIALLLLGSGLGLAACRSTKTADKPPLPVRVHPISAASTTPSTRYSANIEPLVRVDLAFKVGGYVDEILARRVDGKTRQLQEGDQVLRGDMLIHVRDADYRVRVEQARAQVAQAEAALEQARLDFARASQLFENKALPKSSFDGAKAKFNALEATTNAARALVKQAELAMADCALRAPMDGLVLKRLVEVGSLVGAGSPGLVIANTRSMRVVFGVPDMVVGKLRLGSVLPVRVEALPEQLWEGKITRISPVADLKSRLFDIEVTLPNPAQKLRSGMIAALAVPEPGLLAPTPLVPLSAVVRPPGMVDGFAVYVVEHPGANPTARLRMVHLGEIHGNQVAVTDGLQAGEQVVVTGAALVRDGEPVAIRP